MPGLAVTDQLARVVAQLPAGQVRDGQRTMTVAVAKCLGGARHAAVTAGTGTGKSFAYLVPAVLSAKRVVVATATKALQDQLATKDLPLVARGLKLDRPVSWAVLKGRSNYLCRQRLTEMEQAGRQETMDGLGTASGTGGAGDVKGSVGDQVRRLAEWSMTTMSGDRAELDFEPHPAAWSAVSVGVDECPGAHRCPSGADCFTERARAKAAVADVVVVNLHLLGADLRSGGAVLPDYEALVVDEAHELEDVLAACLGVDVSPGRLRGIAAGARSALGSGNRAGGSGSALGSGNRAGGSGSALGSGNRAGGSGNRAGGSGSASDSVVEAVLSAATGLEQALTPARDQRLPQGLGPEIGDAVRLAVSRLVRLETELRTTSTPAGSPAGDRSVPTDAAQKSLRSLLAAERCREELESCLVAGKDEVVWVAGGERVSLKSAPLDVSTILATQVFGEMPVVLTSATLPPGLAERLGAPSDDVTELDVGSPFDYRRHGLVYCAVGLPDRRRAEADAAIHDELEALISAARGRTLGLFTSHRAMQAAATALRGRVPWPVHLQGDLPKAALLHAFSSEHEACLFATMGFWQGVDVAGPTLSLVVIDRLPFPRPDEPLNAARREAAGAMGFRLVDLPRAATLLAQGAGRLIRTETDRGVVAVLDPRLATASYSSYLVKALPPMRRTRDRSEAVAFLEALHAPAPA
jgi:ATP-dependent DNA helicase DinG